jgi:hypothetical protein
MDVALSGKQVIVPKNTYTPVNDSNASCEATEPIGVIFKLDPRLYAHWKIKVGKNFKINNLISNIPG